MIIFLPFPFILSHSKSIFTNFLSKSPFLLDTHGQNFIDWPFVLYDILKGPYCDGSEFKISCTMNDSKISTQSNLSWAARSLISIMCFLILATPMSLTDDNLDIRVLAKAFSELSGFHEILDFLSFWNWTTDTGRDKHLDEHNGKTIRSFPSFV